MSSQQYIPPKTDAEDSKEEREAADRLWRQQQYFRSIIGGNSSGRMLDWSRMPSRSIWR